MRQLSHHEQKLLKKVDFLQWKSTENVREVKVMRRYHIQKREDYIKYGPQNSKAAKFLPIQRICHTHLSKYRKRKSHRFPFRFVLGTTSSVEISKRLPTRSRSSPLKTPSVASRRRRCWKSCTTWASSLPRSSSRRQTRLPSARSVAAGYPLSCADSRWQRLSRRLSLSLSKDVRSDAGWQIQYGDHGQIRMLTFL